MRSAVALNAHRAMQVSESMSKLSALAAYVDWHRYIRASCSRMRPFRASTKELVAVTISEDAHALGSFTWGSIMQ